MCGITGWVDFAGAVDRNTLEAMTLTLARRGPDGSGTWSDTHVGLGHRRLAVIDPAGGAQPMLTEQAVVSYNGEIYNFLEVRAEARSTRAHLHLAVRYRSSAPRLRAVEARCASQGLNGIFAFAIWDRSADELVLVRDRLGVKPLLYYPLADGVLFGSEPKAILANPLVKARASRQELCDALLFLRTPGRTPFRGMFEVKPGHMLRVSRGSLREEHYWKLTARPHTDDMATTIRTVRSLLEDAVSLQMMSDVPLCALLSGGLDSSAVTALADKARRASNGGMLSIFVVDFVG